MSSSPDSSPQDGPVVFQEVLSNSLAQDPGEGREEAVSLAFFELANAPEFAYRLEARSGRKRKRSPMLRYKQDVSACGQHTGGIVWETSVLLFQYLLHKVENGALPPLGRSIEVGAGCGLLGQGLVATLSPKKCVSMIQTETSEVVSNLQFNLDRNMELIDGQEKRIRACVLDWTQLRKDTGMANLTEGTFDTVLGTDVIFRPDLVIPLLETLSFLCNKSSGVAYICVQERCAASLAKFLNHASEYGFAVQDMASDLTNIPICSWGVDVDSHLYMLKRTRKHE